MRRTAYLIPVILCFAVSAGILQAQDPVRIVNQYVKAAGGGKVLSKIRTMALEGTFTNAVDGKPGTYTFDTKLPNRYYSELVLDGKNLIEAYNGKSAWHETPSGEPSTLLGQQGQQLEAASLYYNSRLLNLKKNKLALAFIGHAQVRGKDALQLELTTPAKIRRELFFDPQSHLLVKESAPVAGLDEEILYDDYRPVDGVKLPYKIELHRGPDTYSINITRASINETVGERTFDFPIKSQVKLPDLKALFKEIDENQKVADKIRENYAGTRVEEETDLEKDGKVKKTEVSEYTFFYLNGDEVSTLVKKDGKPLSDEEQKKENEKTQKEIADIQKRQTKKEAKDEKAKEEGKDKKDKDDETSASKPSSALASSSTLAANASAAETSSSLTSSPIPNSSPTKWSKESSTNSPASSGSTSTLTRSPASKPISSATSALPAASSPISRKAPALSSSSPTSTMKSGSPPTKKPTSASASSS